jgi:SAM-dependent methyltransferase
MKLRDDGSAGDVDYAAFGGTYSKYRKPDPRIAALIHSSLGIAATVLNVGAGAGSYEPLDRNVVAVEPSASMRAQRTAHLVEAVNAIAERLPFDDDAFDAAMATFTVHQWSNLASGLREMRRVTRGQIVVLTCDPAEVERFWLNRYAAEVLSAEARRYPNIDSIAAELGGLCDVIAVPIPFDCVDGFNEAYYGRPECLLDAAARLACSAWSFVDRRVVDRFEYDLKRDLDTGRWDADFGHLRQQPEYAGSLRLIVSAGKIATR